LAQSEQVQRVTLRGVSLTSNRVSPQWQLPLIVTAWFLS